MLKLENLSKVYAARQGEYAGGIRNADFDLAPGTFFTLLGPSGCGKTTTLRCIAGLERPDSGRILLDGNAIFDGETGRSLSLHLRNIGMVFQSYAIWPHMTVFENVAFPLRVSKLAKYGSAEISRMVGEALESVGLGGYGKRSATQLSGGQQQRVALARAVVNRPKLLLLDEPLSNLDAALREDMRIELKRLQRELGITAVYVTHDQSEALAMSDRIAVIEKGEVIQIGTPRDIYFRPSNEFVATFVGHTNILRGTLCDGGGGSQFRTADLEGGSRIRCRDGVGEAPGAKVAISIRPESIRLGSAPEQGANCLSGTVVAASFLGNVVHYEVRSRSGTGMLRVEATPSVPFEPGTEVAMMFEPEQTFAIPRSN